MLIDTPDAHFSKFERLGVYGRAEVQDAAEASGHAMALRFSDTEIFPRWVTLRRLTALARELGLPWSSNLRISLSKISNGLFQAVYKEGHREKAALIYQHSDDERQRELAAGLDEMVRAERTKHHKDDPAHHNEKPTGS